MGNPVKIIFKYKNDKKRIQYLKYIFVGKLNYVKCKDILEKIKNLNLFDALTSLSQEEFDKIISLYGDDWFKHFYLDKHILWSLELLEKSSSLKEQLSSSIKIKDWVDNVFLKYALNQKEVNFTYEFSEKEKRARKSMKKTIQELGEKTEIHGGDDEVAQDIYPNDDVDYDLIFDELDKVDKESEETKEEISKIISDSTSVNREYVGIKFNKENDQNSFNMELKNVYKKNYVVHNFIYQDDTIRSIKEKICCSIENNDKFGKTLYIAPASIYLWSEYKHKEKIKKVSLGQKWIIRNEMLDIMVEPEDNLNKFEELKMAELKILYENIRNQMRVKWEDNDAYLLNDYENYVSNNEIYMVDIYNELGLGYSPTKEEFDNLINVYLKIYFHRIPSSNYSKIIEFLQGKNKNELEDNKMIYDSLNNDLIMESEIMGVVEDVKTEFDFKKALNNCHILQSVVKCYLLNDYKIINLYRIFDNFELDDKYPFVQFQQTDNNPKFKYSTEHLSKIEDKSIIQKWFENSPYGLNFKIKIKNTEPVKYIMVGLSEYGRIDYKINWKEADGFLLDDMSKTYSFIRELIEKINLENSKYNLNLNVPKDEDFDFAFINTIQKFTLEDNFKINHNDLNDFSRNFFPYVSVVIEPRKRLSKDASKEVSKGKYGTYLRYKRKSNYENRGKIESRILYYLKNYEYDETNLVETISREFNLTNDLAFSEIKYITGKFTNIKQNRKVLKKMDELPKYKPPGISIEIQGKTRDNYKIKLDGVKNKVQLENIVIFTNILIYLYQEAYLKKTPKYEELKHKLKQLNKVAKRKNLVVEYVDYSKEFLAHNNNYNVKNIIALDSKRLKTGDSDSNYPTECQNSGWNNRRRPMVYKSKEELEEKGYKIKKYVDGNDKYHLYEKEIIDPETNKVVNSYVVELPLDNENITSEYIYYGCDPVNNGRHMYIGFLKNSDKPCCFIKNHLLLNDAKKNLFLSKLGVKKEIVTTKPITNDKLYILNDSNIIQIGRYAYLPKNIDTYFNKMLNNFISIKNYYLEETSGYFLKYSIIPTPQENKYLFSIATLFGLEYNNIIKNIETIFKKDAKYTIFNSLNNGNIRKRFTTQANYVNNIKNNVELGHEYLSDLMEIPGVITDTGVIVFTMTRSYRSISEVEHYELMCNNHENILNLSSTTIPFVLLLKSRRAYFPIIKIKKNINEDNVNQENYFYYKDAPKNIIKHLLIYYSENCSLIKDLLYKSDFMNFTAKNIINYTNEEFQIREQYLDNQYKCRYLVTSKNYLIPVYPSGSIYYINVCKDYLKYIKSLEDTVSFLKILETHLWKETGEYLDYVPEIYYYSDIINGKYRTNSIILKNKLSVPILETDLDKSYVLKNNMKLEKNSVDDFIDEKIKNEITGKIDNRIIEISNNKYYNELYQLFRLHISYFLNETKSGQEYKKHIQEIVDNKNGNRQINRHKLKALLYEISDLELFDKFSKLIDGLNKLYPEKNVSDEWLLVSKQRPTLDYSTFKLDNVRKLCYINVDQKECNSNFACSWNHNKCVFHVSQSDLVDYVNYITEELMQKNISYMEIMQLENYRVSSIRNNNIFKEKEGVQLLTSINVSSQKILKELFGESDLPIIGKRRLKYTEPEEEEAKLNSDNPLKEHTKWYVQNIFEASRTIYRAIANSMYWIKKKYSDTKKRNLGYFGEIQTKLSDLYFSKMIDWIKDSNNSVQFDKIKEMLSIKDNNKYILEKLLDRDVYSENGIMEFCIMSILLDRKIIIYDKNYYMTKIIDGVNILYDSTTNSEYKLSKSDEEDSIHIKYSGYNVEAMYIK